MSIKIEYFSSIENISTQDLMLIHKIDLNYFPTPWTQSAWLDLFNSSANRLLVTANDQDGMCGFALLEISVVDSFAHLLKIVVVPDYQKEGRGKELLSSSMNYLKVTKNINNFFLEVAISNLAAISLYKKLNFEVIHRKKDFYGTNIDAFIMTHGQSHLI